MKIKVTDTILGMDGAPLKNGEEELTYRDVFYNALNTFRPEEKPSDVDKTKCFEVMQILFASDEPELKVDQATLLKERVGKTYTPIVYGRVCELIDGAGKEE